MLDTLSNRFEEERMAVGGEIGTAAVDVAEWDGDYLVIADIPGFEREDIDLRLRDGTLHISATHKGEHEPEVERYHRRERAHRSVSRTVDLPGPVEEEAAEATYENGVLSVTLPKAHQTDPEEGRQISIQ